MPIPLFKEFISESNNSLQEDIYTEDEKRKLLDSLVTGIYTFDKNGEVNVKGNVYYNGKAINLKDIQFNIIYGDYMIINCHLKTLKGSPKKVTGLCMLTGNDFTTLEGCPEYVGRDFAILRSKITSLEFSPKHIGGHYAYDCDKVQLPNLVGITKDVPIEVYNKLSKSLRGIKFFKSYLELFR